MRLELFDLIDAICSCRNPDTQDWEAYCARDALRDDDEVVTYVKALFLAGHRGIARQRARTWCDDPRSVLHELDELQQATEIPTERLISDEQELVVLVAE